MQQVAAMISNPHPIATPAELAARLTPDGINGGTVASPADINAAVEATRRQPTRGDPVEHGHAVLADDGEGIRPTLENIAVAAVAPRRG